MTSPASPRSRVLVIDDDPDILESVEALIQAQLPECDVETAATAEAALKLLMDETDERPVAAILSDYRLPGIDGVDLLRAVHAQQPGARCMMMTTFIEDAKIQRALDEGVIEQLLDKPVDPFRVLDLLRDASS